MNTRLRSKQQGHRSASRRGTKPPLAKPRGHVPEIVKKARWIWPENLHWDLHNCYALFRCRFELAKLPKRAPLFITADQSYHLYLNGRYVCRGPARGFQESWPYDEVDVRPFLRVGPNLIAVRAYNPGRSNFTYVHEGYAGLLVAAKWGNTEILTGRGQSEIVANGDWKCRRQSGVVRDTVPSSLQLFDQEWIDLREESPEWAQPEFDDSGWTGISYASRTWNQMPWFGLEPRAIPLLEEKEVAPVSLLGQAAGRDSRDVLITRNIALNRWQEGMAHRAFVGAADKLVFPAAGPGRWNSFIVDFGKIVVGSPELTIRGAAGGEVVETFHCETINPDDSSPDFQPETHCRMAFANRLLCRPGQQAHTFFHPIGFRYAVITVRGNRRPLEVGITVRSTLYPMEQKGTFAHSDQGLEAIWQACAWTQRICALDAYVDTPWREQAQWLADARVQAANTFYYNGDARLFRRGINQIARQTTPDGLTYGHAPTMAHNCVLPDFTLLWMATLHDHYWQTGSTEPFLDNQATLRGALDYFRDWMDPHKGLLRHDKRYWLFLDWTDLQKDGCPTAYSLWLLYALDRLAALASVSNMKREAAEWRAWAKGLRKALQPLWSAGGLLRDGILPNGKTNPECSVHTQTLALLTDLAANRNASMLDQVLLPFIRGRKEFTARPSAYWITYVYSALISNGHEADVLPHLQQHWLPMADFGTTSERFAEDAGSSSRSHAWSSHPLVHLMTIGSGIHQTGANWKTVDYRPTFLGERAEVELPTPHGTILSSWRREPKAIHATLVLPRGVSARVVLPGHEHATATGRNRFTVKCSGL